MTSGAQKANTAEEMGYAIERKLIVKISMYMNFTAKVYGSGEEIQCCFCHVEIT